MTMDRRAGRCAGHRNFLSGYKRAPHGWWMVENPNGEQPFQRCLGCTRLRYVKWGNGSIYRNPADHVAEIRQWIVVGYGDRG